MVGRLVGWREHGAGLAQVGRRRGGVQTLPSLLLTPGVGEQTFRKADSLRVLLCHSRDIGELLQADSLYYYAILMTESDKEHYRD